MVNKNSDCLFHFENKAMVLKYLLFTFLFFCNNKIYTLYKKRLFIIDIQYIKKMMLCNHKSITSGQKDIYLSLHIYLSALFNWVLLFNYKYDLGYKKL